MPNLPYFVRRMRGVRGVNIVAIVVVVLVFTTLVLRHNLSLSNRWQLWKDEKLGVAFEYPQRARIEAIPSGFSIWLPRHDGQPSMYLFEDLTGTVKISNANLEEYSRQHFEIGPSIPLEKAATVNGNIGGVPNFYELPSGYPVVHWREFGLSDGAFWYFIDLGPRLLIIDAPYDIEEVPIARRILHSMRPVSPVE